MRQVIVILGILACLIPLPASAQDKPADPPPKAADSPPPPKPMTEDEAVAAVLEAFKAKDEARLKALAGKDDPDPWIVADELCARGTHDAAEAFAGVAPRKDVERLQEYVAARRRNPTGAGARDALASANAALAAKQWGQALAAIEGAETGGDDVTSIRLEHARGQALGGLRRYEEGVSAFRRAADAAERLGWFARTAASLHRGGMSAVFRSDWRTALELWERMLAIEESRGNRHGLAAGLANIGILHYSLGDYPRALDVQQRALGLLEELGNRAGIAKTLGNIGNIHYSLGDYPRSLDFQERALRLKQEIGDSEGVAATLGNIGILYDCLGDYPKALDYKERALKLSEELGDREGVAVNLGNIGTIYLYLGDYPRALDYHDRSLRLKQELGDRAGIALTLGNIGLVHAHLRDYPRALDFHEQALKLKQELGDREGVALTLGHIGNIHYSLEDYPRALDFQERALKLSEEIGERAVVATTLGVIGAIQHRLGDYSKALATGERAVAEAERLGARHTLVLNLQIVASARLARGEPREAVLAARRAVSEMAGLVRGLGEEQGTTSREQFAEVFETGGRAALALGDASETAFFVESGRAGALLEGLKTRETLWAAALPENVRRTEAEARTAESMAATNLRKALDAGDVEVVKARRGDLDAARLKVKDANERIQREAKAAANVLYPGADSLETIRARLREGEALVLYGLHSEESLALVVLRDGARIVRLGKTKEIEAACGALATDREQADPGPALERLRKLVVDPLELDDTVKRVLVSPHGALSYVPFALLAGERELAYVPSGTTYGLLLEERGKRGEGILALGDPDYGTPRDARAVAILRAGDRLLPLPGTREEAKALGTTVLLGKEATEEGLRRALAKVPRWKAVHLACHGLVDVERPMLSALAITPSGEDDGFLSVLDLFRMKVPAELVVLSACETGRGRIYKAEGIVGLTRAFMFAGAPRVLVSLWKVDDEATKALMVKFYELWNPKDGAKGLGAAAALKAAQAFVASQPKWKHPKYWAAWVLWGLPE